MAALEYWLWLSSAAVSPRAKSALLERFGDAEPAFFAPSGAFSGLDGLSHQEALTLEKRDLSRVQEIAHACRQQEPCERIVPEEFGDSVHGAPPEIMVLSVTGQ